jgi:hypothetical protein
MAETGRAPLSTRANAVLCLATPARPLQALLFSAVQQPEEEGRSADERKNREREWALPMLHAAAIPVRGRRAAQARNAATSPGHAVKNAACVELSFSVSLRNRKGMDNILI